MKSIAKSIAGGGFPKHPGQGPSEISKNVPCRHWTTKVIFLSGMFFVIKYGVKV